jgi:hypothetical protein
VNSKEPSLVSASLESPGVGVLSSQKECSVEIKKKKLRKEKNHSNDLKQKEG